MTIIGVLLITILVGGGVSLAAENSLPGDALYVIKVNVNENIRAAFTLSAEGRAEWEIRRAERRLEEAEKLAARGELNAEARAQIEANFEAHAERVKERIAEFEARENFKAAADVSSNFETSLRAHQNILSRMEGTDSILVKINVEVSEVSQSRAEAETKFSASPDVKEAAEGKLGATKQKEQEVERFIALKKVTLGAEATAEAEVRLAEAKKSIAEGEARLNAGAYGEAFIAFQRADRMLQEAKLLIEARGILLDIQVGPTSATATVPETRGRVDFEIRY